MKKAQKLFIFITLLLLSLCLLGQEKQSSPLSYSLSYIPPYLYSFEGDFGVLPIYTNFEANIHYKPFDRISFTSGLGYFIDKEKVPKYYLERLKENNRSYQEAMSSFRIPLQLNYHLVINPKKTDGYMKATFVNGLWIDKVINYEGDGSAETSRSATYLPSVALGIGAIFLKHKAIGILLEGTIEKFLRFDSFSNTTMYSLKIGIII